MYKVWYVVKLCMFLTPTTCQLELTATPAACRSSCLSFRLSLRLRVHEESQVNVLTTPAIIQILVVLHVSYLTSSKRQIVIKGRPVRFLSLSLVCFIVLFAKFLEYSVLSPVLLVDRLWQGSPIALWTFIAPSFGLTIAAIVQNQHQQLTLFKCPI